MHWFSLSEINIKTNIHCKIFHKTGRDAVGLIICIADISAMNGEAVSK